MTRGKIWILGLLFSAVTWALLVTLSHAVEPVETKQSVDAKTATLPKISAWIHVFGCPKGVMDTIVIFVDGKVAILKDKDLSEMERAKLTELLAPVPGKNMVFTCGNDI